MGSKNSLPTPAPLPDLPKPKERIESKVDTPILKWFFKNWPRSIMIEVKLVGGRLTDHQKTIVRNVTETRNFMYKHPDMGQRTALDGFVMKQGDVAVCWYDKFTKKCWCDINSGQQKVDVKISGR